jgi:hypothetical protein
LPASLPPSFWTTWGELGQGLRQQISLQGQLEQSATASRALSQSESESTSNIETSLSQASNALDQTSTGISSATASSATTSAAIDQGIKAAVKTDSDIAQAEAFERGLKLKAGLWRALALSGVLGVVGALAGPALGTDSTHGALYGAALGAAGGGVWIVIELWPPRIKLP